MVDAMGNMTADARREAFRSLVQASGWNQVEVAARLGVTRSYINSVCNGRKKPGHLLLHKLQTLVRQISASASLSAEELQMRPTFDRFLGLDSATPATALDDLSRTLLSRYRDRFNLNFGQVKILTMHESVSLDSIFTPVRLLSYQAKPDTTTNPRDAFSIIKDHQYLRILGCPGAGKSTLLKRVALTVLNAWHITRGTTDQFPVLIELGKLYPDPTLLNGALTKAIVEQFTFSGFPTPEAFVTYALQCGKFLILLDGVDEVPSSMANDILSQLDRLLSQYPQNKFIVSCRTGLKWTPPPHFSDYELAPFNDSQIQDFLKRWFAAWGQKNGIDTLLWNAITKPGNRSVLTMARTPLLLTFICMIYDVSYGLPTNRALLCKGVLEILMFRWNAHKRIRRADIHRGLHAELERMMLSEIAGHMFQQNAETCSKDELIDAIRAFLQRELQAGKCLHAQELFDAIEVQQGIFVEITHERYAFCHSALRDYLVALYYKDNDGLKQLARERVFQPLWHDILVIGAGLSKADIMLEVMSGTITKDAETNASLIHLLHHISKMTSEDCRAGNGALIRAISLWEHLSLLALWQLPDLASTRQSSTFATIHCALKAGEDIVSALALDCNHRFAEIDNLVKYRERLLDLRNRVNRLMMGNQAMSRLFGEFDAILAAMLDTARNYIPSVYRTSRRKMNSEALGGDFVNGVVLLTKCDDIETFRKEWTRVTECILKYVGVVPMSFGNSEITAIEKYLTGIKVLLDAKTGALSLGENTWANIADALFVPLGGASQS